MQLSLHQLVLMFEKKKKYDAAGYDRPTLILLLMANMSLRGSYSSTPPPLLPRLSSSVECVSFSLSSLSSPNEPLSLM